MPKPAYQVLQVNPFTYRIADDNACAGSQKERGGFPT